MSTNKFKYFAVTTTSVVRANNKADAEKLAMASRPKLKGTPGEVLYKDVEIDRITAVSAQEQISN